MDGNGLISLREAAAELGVHYMTAYRYVRTGRLPAVQVANRWSVDRSDLVALAANPPSPGRPGASEATTRRTARVRRFEGRLVGGDERGAWTIIEEALGTGATPGAILLDLLAPALRSIGQRWAAGDLTVGDEHRASGVALRVVGRLGPLAARRGPRRGTVVVGAPPDERHLLPVAMAADLLRARAFEVVDLGADVPVDMFVRAAASARPLAVAVGATVAGRTAAVQAVVEALQDHTPGLPVLAGGAGLPDDADARRLGALWSGTDGSSLVAAVEALRPPR